MLRRDNVSIIRILGPITNGDGSITGQCFSATDEASASHCIQRVGAICHVTDQTAILFPVTPSMQSLIHHSSSVKHTQRVQTLAKVENAIRPVESHRGVRETILTTPFRRHRDRGAERKGRGYGRGDMGSECPHHHLTRKTGERRKLPQRGPGRIEPRPKIDFV